MITRNPRRKHPKPIYHRRDLGTGNAESIVENLNPETPTEAAEYVGSGINISQPVMIILGPMHVADPYILNKIFVAIGWTLCGSAVQINAAPVMFSPTCTTFLLYFGSSGVPRKGRQYARERPQARTCDSIGLATKRHLLPKDIPPPRDPYLTDLTQH